MNNAFVSGNFMFTVKLFGFIPSILTMIVKTYVWLTRKTNSRKHSLPVPRFILNEPCYSPTTTITFLVIKLFC